MSSPANVDRPLNLGRYEVREPLGKGGTATVYLGFDTELQRVVAVKVLRPELFSSPTMLGLFQAEAKILAQLDHPAIIPIYDVGTTPDGQHYIVSKLYTGGSLQASMEAGRLPLRQAVAIVTSIADALHHAHQRGLVHRDVKPANVMFDSDGRPAIGDFGLAMRRESFGTGPAFVGTPAYMSPEQARRESHRVDARTDVYGLGAVLYELLAGRPPFRAETRDALLEQIKREPPRPPRDIDPSIPAELERICLKALAKRAADRFETARELADDLRHWLAETEVSHPTADSAKSAAEARTSSGGPAKLIPRGLRAFEGRDADFFIDLLPGPRNRDGLPESVAFWLHRLEALDPEASFAVGLLYGPSGCGKSSLVRAGILPRLAAHVHAVFVEARTIGTEDALRQALIRRFPRLAETHNLAEMLAELRRGQLLRIGEKLVIVLDQFEQRLHASRPDDTALIDALRQCDGVRLQCLLLVRDDFWLPMSRFLRELEIALADGANCALVDLFDPAHARSVLAEIGRAYGRLPARPAPLNAEQERFLQEAVEELAEEDKIISVRLALFAEMVKSRDWQPATLRQVGGARGLGVAFLEESFDARTAPAPQRRHAAGARAVLGALLPPANTAIRATGCSEEELRRAAEYSDPREFDELMRLLDGDLRLLTPAAEGDAGRYQLAHDYLVQPIRTWLQQRQRQTRRGRAELRLAERGSAWEARPDSRSLPFAWEWLSIVLFTDWKSWTPGQRKMMRQAAWRHLTRGMVALVALLLLGWGGSEIWARLEERARRQRLLHPDLTPEAREYLKDLDFSELIANLPGTFYLKDLNGVYIYANDNWVWSDEKKKMVFLRGVDLIGKTDFDMEWKADAEMFRKQDREVVSTGEAHRFESHNVYKEGKRAPYVTLMAPLRDRHGTIIGIIGYTLPKAEMPMK